MKATLRGQLTDDSHQRLRGAIWASFAAHQRSAVVERAFKFWRAHGFPHYRLTNRQISQEFSTLRLKDWRPVFIGQDLRSSNLGLRLANSFQPSMWKAKVSRYLTPWQVFRDDQLLRSAIERSLRLWPDRFGAKASCLRRILKTFPGAASVSNYRPMVAKALVAKYSQEGDLVIDFSAGYGGRLLGALALNRRYLGIEPNRTQIEGLRRMMKALGSLGFSLPKVILLNGVAEKELRTVKRGCSRLVYSSPPFFNWEHYSSSRSQSFKRYPSYELWRTRFLALVIAESYRILKIDGYLALNVTNGNRLPSQGHVQEAARAVGFRLVGVHKMVFPKVPYLHPRKGGPIKRELVLVFKK